MGRALPSAATSSTSYFHSYPPTIPKFTQPPPTGAVLKAWAVRNFVPGAKARSLATRHAWLAAARAGLQAVAAACLG